jgi:hypothetical protein
MIEKKQITVGRLIGIYTNRGHHDYVIITWVNKKQNAVKFTSLDTLIESQKFKVVDLWNEIFPVSKKEVFLYFSNQKKKINGEIKKLQDKKIKLAQMQVKAKHLIKTPTGK